MTQHSTAQHTAHTSQSCFSPQSQELSPTFASTSAADERYTMELKQALWMQLPVAIATACALAAARRVCRWGSGDSTAMVSGYRGMAPAMWVMPRKVLACRE
eukprot:1159148-Pelagomonas_calceolata.AAC.23